MSLAGPPSLVPEALDRASHVPLYAQLIDQLRKHIGAGTWTVASRLPSERELCDAFHVSRITVRQAIQALVREGVLIQTSGRGTYLSDQGASAIARSTLLAAGHLLQHGTHPGGWRFTPLQASAPPHVLSVLAVEEGVALTCLSRWRRPDVRETVYLPNDRCPGLRMYYKDDVPLYATLLRYYGIVAEQATLQWYATPSPDAVTGTARAGNVEPVLRIQQTTFDSDGLERVASAVKWNFVDALEGVRAPDSEGVRILLIDCESVEGFQEAIGWLETQERGRNRTVVLASDPGIATAAVRGAVHGNPKKPKLSKRTSDQTGQREQQNRRAPAGGSTIPIVTV